MNPPLQNSREDLTYAIVFDLETATLRKEYGDPCDQAYFEIREKLKTLGFNWIQGNVYLHKGEDGLTAVYRAISKFSGIAWFKKAVRDIRVFKVEDWSDFTDIVKRG